MAIAYLEIRSTNGASIRMERSDPHTRDRCNHKLSSVICNKSYDKNAVQQVPHFLAADNRSRISLEGNLSSVRPATQLVSSLRSASTLSPILERQVRAFVNYTTANANFPKSYATMCQDDLSLAARVPPSFQGGNRKKHDIEYAVALR